MGGQGRAKHSKPWDKERSTHRQEQAVERALRGERNYGQGGEKRAHNEKDWAHGIVKTGWMV